jgi:hypothetical protein
LVASHVRSLDRKQTQYDWQHYIPLIERKPGALRNGAPFADMPQPFMRLRALLLKHEGGDRVMAKVLATVPRSGLEAVLVAVERVLESGHPSAEHVENVLNRLKSVAPPPSVETHLEVSEEPVADTARYDLLREEVDGEGDVIRRGHLLDLFQDAPECAEGARLIPGETGHRQFDLNHAGGISECKKITSMVEAYDIAIAPHCRHIEVFNGPGLGINVNEEKVREMAKIGHNWKNPVWRTASGVITKW